MQKSKQQNQPLSLKNISSWKKQEIQAYLDNALEMFDSSPAQAIDLLEAIYNLREKIIYPEMSLRAKYAYGYIYTRTGDYRTATPILMECVPIAKELKEDNIYLRSQVALGMIYGHRGIIDMALEYLLTALEYSKKQSRDDVTALIYNNLGLIYYDIGDIEKSLEYNGLSLELKNKINDIKGQASSLNNLGLLYHEQNQYDKALKVFEESLKLKRQLNDRQGEANTLNNIGELYVKTNQPAKAAECLQRSLDIKQEIHDSHGCGSTLANLALALAMQGKKELSLDYASKAIQVASEIDSNRLRRVVYQKYALVHKYLGNYKEAVHYYELHSKLIDTIHDLEQQARSKEIVERLSIIEREKQAHKQLEHNLKVQKVLFAISAAVNTTINLTELYSIIHQQLSDILDCTNFYIGLWEQNGDKISVPYYIDTVFTEKPDPVVLRTSLTSYVVKTAKPLLINEDERNDMIKQGMLPPGDWRAKQWMGVPLKITGKIIGVVAVQSYCNHSQYSKNDLRLLEFVSEQIALAIDHKNHQQDVLREKEYYHSFVDSLTDWVWEMNMEGIHTYTNKAVTKILGYKTEEVLGHSAIDLWLERHKTPQVLAQFYSELEAGHGWNHHGVEFRHRDGHGVFVHSVAHPIYDKEGKLCGYRGVDRDISNEIASAQEKRLLTAATEQAANAIIITDMQSLVQYVNPSFCKHTGYAIEDVIGLPIRNLTVANHTPEERQRMHSMIFSGQVYKGNMRARRKDGSFYEVESSITPIKDDNGTLRGFVWLQRDVTKIRELEKQLRQSQKMEAIGTLAGGIAHDFNNILSVILGYAELSGLKLAEDANPSPELEEIIKAGNRAKELVSQILTFSRRSESTKSPVQAAPLIKEATKLLRASIPSSIVIDTQLTSRSWLKADPTQLHQIIINLCTNAAYAMRENGGKLTVQLDDIQHIDLPEAHANILAKKSWIRLRVADTGAGIPPEIKERVFEPYFTTKPAGEGTGMGLAIIHGIVKSSGGEIFVESAPNKGTCFDIYFPITDSQLGKHRDESLIVPTKGAKILYVDDETQIAELANDFLGRLGYEVSQFDDAGRALQEFSRDPNYYQVIVTDLTMPGIGGLQLAAAIRQYNQDVPIILCTGNQENVTESQMQDCNLEGIIDKPIDFKKLMILIEQSISK